ITLRDLVQLYTALSNGGIVAPLRYRRGEAANPGTAIFGPLAAWYVEDILIEAPSPPGVLPAELRSGRRLAFKTGTSYGYRDFWAVGWDSAVTIGMWVGRPDGTPMPGRSGRLTAAPVLFKIADLIGPPELPGSTAPPARSVPSGAFLVAERDLPPRLQRLDPGPLAAAASPASAPKIVFPPDGALIEWRGEELPLEAAGGKQPLRWLVDGRPLPPGLPRRPLYWLPEGIGFAELTVIDADGHSARSHVRLSP